MSTSATEIGGGQKSQVYERLLAGTGVAAAAAGAAAVWYFDPTTQSIFPVCPLNALTGFACPGCGLTRGFHALFRGDIITALDFNALIPVFGAFIGYLLLSMFLFAVRGRGLAMGRFNGPMLWAVFVLMLVFGVVRNVPVYPFSVLYP